MDEQLLRLATNGTASGGAAGAGSPLANLSQALFVTFGIIGLGYVLRAASVIHASAAAGIGSVTGKVILPALLFNGMASLELGSVTYGVIGAIALGKTIVELTAIAFAVLTSSKGNRLSKAGIYAIASTQSNDFAFGLLLVRSVQSTSAFAEYIYLIAPVQLAILNPIGFALLEAGAATRSIEGSRASCGATSRKILVNLATNPVVFMTVIGLLYGQVVGPPTGALRAIVSTIGDAFPMSALFSLGLSIHGRLGVLKGRAVLQPLFLVLLKCLVLPVLIRLLLPAFIDTVTTGAGTFVFIYGALPMAPSVYIFAAQYSVFPERMSATMVLSMLISAPVLYLTVVFLTAAGSDGLWSAIVFTEVFIGIVGAAAAGIFLIAVSAFSKTRRAPWTIIAALSALQLVLAVANAVCVDSVSPSPGLYFVLSTAVTAQRLLLLGLAFVLLWIARSQTRRASRWARVCPVVALTGGAAWAGLWTAVGSTSQDEMTVCLFRYGKAEAGGNLLLGLVETTAIAFVLFTVERVHQQAHLPHRFAAVLSAKRRPSIEAPGAGLNSSLLASEGATSEAGHVELDSGDETMSQAPVEEDTTDSVSSEDFVTGVSDKLRVQLLLLWELALQLLMLATAFVFTFTGPASLREPAMLQVRIVAALMLFGSGLFTSLIFGLNSVLTERVNEAVAKLSKAVRRFVFDAKDIRIPETGISTETADRVRQLLYDVRASGLLRTRVYGVRRYKQCISGEDLVSFLVDAQHCPSRRAAVELGQQLGAAGALFHVTKEHEFEDRPFFYRLAPLPGCPEDAEEALRAALAAGLFHSCKRRFTRYKKVATGEEIVSWIVQNTDHAPTRSDAVRLGRVLVAHGKLRHVRDEHGFDDTEFLFSPVV